MKSLEEITNDFRNRKQREKEQLEAELNVEHQAARAYHERTGHQFHFLNPVAQRKEIEKWKEENQ
jgi:hypothetical protein